MAATSPADARAWKQTPNAAALEYSQITDSRDHQVYFVWWLSQPSFQEKGLEPLLGKYFVLAVAHGRMDPGLDVSFEKVAPPDVKDADGKSLKLVKEEDLNPGAVMLISGFKSLMPRMIGPMGKGMEVFLYDPGSVRACKSGKVSVVMPHETYTYVTPLPGCDPMP